MRVFGSAARGEERPDSDLDVFVMVDERDLDIDRTIVFAACDVYDELDLPFIISPLIMTRQHFDDLVRSERLIARDILNEGIAL